MTILIPIVAKHKASGSTGNSPACVNAKKGTCWEHTAGHRAVIKPLVSRHLSVVQEGFAIHKMMLIFIVSALEFIKMSRS